MEISIRAVDRVKIVSLSGRLDSSVADNLMDQFKSLVESGQVQLVCNMANAEYISSSGLRALLGTLKKTRTQQGDLRLACLPSCVKEVLDMAGFTQLFRIFPTEEEAIDSLKQ